MELDASPCGAELSSSRDSEVTSPKSRADDAFLELSMGRAELTSAVRRQGLTVHEVGGLEAGSSVEVSTNLLCHQTFAAIKSQIKRRAVRWLHLSPPCKTFTKTRKRDSKAKVVHLRSVMRPGGIEPKARRVREENL